MQGRQSRGKMGKTLLPSRYMCFVLCGVQVQVRWEHCLLPFAFLQVQADKQTGEGEDLVSCIYYLGTTTLIHIGLILRYTIAKGPVKIGSTLPFFGQCKELLKELNLTECWWQEIPES